VPAKWQTQHELNDGRRDYLLRSKLIDSVLSNFRYSVNLKSWVK
jgi:hypothetical protein